MILISESNKVSQMHGCRLIIHKLLKKYLELSGYIITSSCKYYLNLSALKFNKSILNLIKEYNKGQNIYNKTLISLIHLMLAQHQQYIKYLQSLLIKNKIQYESIHMFDPQEQQVIQKTNQIPYQTNIDPNQLSVAEVERYSRQMLLKEITYNGQLKLKNAKIAIIGCGGIGCPASLYLAAAGVGRISLFDSDKVQLNNLHRQIGHKTESIGAQKVVSLLDTLRSINPNIIIDTNPAITPETVHNLDKSDIIIDGSDNPKCRYIVNDYCIQNNKILFSGACIGWEAQITAFSDQNACYRCLWGNDQVSTGGCATRGVVGMIPGLVGNILGIQVFKYIISGKTDILGNMILYDGLLAAFRKTKLRPKKQECLACGKQRLDIKTYDYSKFDAQCVLAPPEVQNISWKQLNEKGVKTSEILDVRSSAMFGIVNLQGTTNIPLQQLRSYSQQKLKQRIGKLLDSQQYVYVMCKRGNDSRRASKLLQEKGFKAINIVGGIQGYGREFQTEIPSI